MEKEDHINSMKYDMDLESIQEVRNVVAASKQACFELAELGGDRINRIIGAIAESCAAHAERLAKLAVEETGFGLWQDKVLKNLLGSVMTYEYIKNQRTNGIIKEDKISGIVEIAVPMGIIAALIPSTNPTSTVMYKAIISIKAGNSIIISPHPNAQQCIRETVKVITEAAKSAGAPDCIVQCVQHVTKESTHTLLCHHDVGMILATGGEAMVKAAYSSGNPAIGVGPGNGPAYIEKSADIRTAIRHIIESKTFDNGTICASEQSIVAERCIEDKVKAELKLQGGFLLNDEQSKRLSDLLMRANNTMNPRIVGKSAATIAEMANIRIPAGTRVLISKQSTVSKENPYAREKLCPVLAFYVENSWGDACDRCIELLNNEGLGHTMTIHTEDQHVLREFALHKPVSRLLVNTPASLGGTGATTSLQPAFTLGCGSVGGSSTSDNIGPMNLLNVRRVAYGKKELSELRNSNHLQSNPMEKMPNDTNSEDTVASAISSEEISAIVQQVLEKMAGLK